MEDQLFHENPVQLEAENRKVEQELKALNREIERIEKQLELTENVIILDQILNKLFIYFFFLQRNNDLIKETIELGEYYESLQIDFISILNGLDIPNIDEKLSIDNFNSYFDRLQTKYVEMTCKRSEHRQMFLSVLQRAFQDYQIPVGNSVWIFSTQSKITSN